MAQQIITKRHNLEHVALSRSILSSRMHVGSHRDLEPTPGEPAQTYRKDWGPLGAIRGLQATGDWQRSPVPPWCDFVMAVSEEQGRVSIDIGFLRRNRSMDGGLDEWKEGRT